MYLYRLHTVDLYFWTPDDATLFLDSLKRVVQPHQLQIVANPHAQITPTEPKADVTNPLVAKLEKAAISQSSPSPSNNSLSFPGPPTAPAPAPSTSPGSGSGNFAPMAYNPAAPAAPEPIAPREKTPPPPDAADGTGLGTAALNDQHPGAPYGNPFQASFAPQPTSGGYMPGPPARTNTQQSFSGPSPTPGIQRQNTAGSMPPPPPQSPPSFAPPPSAPPPASQPGAPSQQYATYPGSPGHAPSAVQSPGYSAPSGTPLPSPGYSPQHHQQQQQQYQPLTSPPPGGFTQYQYGSTTGQVPGAVSAQHAQHQQLYRPTEQEASVDGNEPTSGPRNSNLGRRAEKVEKGVGKFLKKLDKKF
jgi:hypothetical protein